MNNINALVKSVTGDFRTANPFEIAKFLNLDVRYFPLGKRPLGKIIYDDKGPFIILNSSIEFSNNRYFTLAHEIGHYIMHNDFPGYYNGSKYLNDRVELQANHFASGIVVLLFMDEYIKYPNLNYELKQA